MADDSVPAGKVKRISKMGGGERFTAIANPTSRRAKSPHGRGPAEPITAGKGGRTTLVVPEGSTIVSPFGGKFSHLTVPSGCSIRIAMGASRVVTVPAATTVR